MKQILVCSNCDYQLSDALDIFVSSMSECPALRMGGWETPIADKGTCFHSKVDLIDASSAFLKLRSEAKKRKMLPFRRKKPVSFSLGEIEAQAKRAVARADHICFSHLRFSPQYWVSIFDIMHRLQSKEYVSWGWEGTNMPNVCCPNCDTPVGTEITYTVDIPDTFIPENEKTKWQIAK